MHEQFPHDVIERLRQLVPIMKDARNKGPVAYLRDNKRYVDHRRFYPRFHEARPQVPAQDNHSRHIQIITLISVPTPSGPAIPGPQAPLQRASQPAHVHVINQQPILGQSDSGVVQEDQTNLVELLTIFK